jgi:hypothetical protein
MESGRSDALFDDPLAAGLAGEWGLRIAATLPDGAWVVAIRTVVIDGFVRSAIASGGIDTIINIGAGLDTRPYRMELPSSLRWVEVDHPHVIERKTALLRDETPRCAIERWGLDLTDGAGRKELFGRLAPDHLPAWQVFAELLGLSRVKVWDASLADDLHTMPSCELWVTEYFLDGS